MLEYVYRNQPAGKMLLGQMIDRIYLNSTGWKGIRKREQILKGVLWQAIQDNLSQGVATRLLDVACGGGRYDLEVLRNVPANAVVATLRDYKPENVKKRRNWLHNWVCLQPLSRPMHLVMQRWIR